MPAPVLPALTDESWAIRARDVAHRNELLDYAASKGVPIWSEAKKDSSLDIGWCVDLIIYSAWQPKEGWVSEEDFKAMCDAYQSQQINH